MKPKTKDLDKMRAKLAQISGKNARRSEQREPKRKTADAIVWNRERSKSAKRSKNKGSSYERKIAAKFSTWSGEVIKRTPQSGGWGSGSDFGVSGDLVCANPSFFYHIECKKREGWGLEDLLTGVRKRHSKSIIEWWDQTTKTCPAGKLPMLVFARNNVTDLCMLRRGDIRRVAKHDFTLDFLPHFPFEMEGTVKGDGPVVIFALNDFLLKVRPPKGTKNRKKWKPPTPAAIVSAADTDSNDTED